LLLRCDVAAVERMYSDFQVSTCMLMLCTALSRQCVQVRAVFLDDIMQQPDLPELDMVADYETRSLRCGSVCQHCVWALLL
jgi:hypothetical protein